MYNYKLLCSTVFAVSFYALSGTAFAGSCPGAGLNTISTAITTTCNLAAGESVEINTGGSIIKNTSTASLSPIYARIDGTIDHITNDGTIENAGGSAIYLGEGTSTTGTNFDHNVTLNNFTNNGTIQNTSRGLYLNSVIITNDLINNGTIDTSSISIFIVDDTRLIGDIINNGTIKSSASNAFHTTNAPGNGTADLQGKIKNYGIFSGNGYAIFTGTGGITIQGGIYNYTGADMVGAINAPTSNFTNSGVLTLKSGVDLADIAESGNVSAESFVNNFTQTSGGVLRIYADNTTTRNTNYSAITVADTASVAGTINVDVQTGLPTTGTLDNVIQATTLMGSLPTVTDNSLAHKFVAVNDGSNNIDLTISSTGFSTVKETTTGGTNASRAATVIDGTAVLQDLFGSLNSSGDVVAAVNATAPLIAGDASAILGTSLSATNRIIQARIEGSSGMSTGNNPISEKYFWIKPFANLSDQEASNGYNGYNSNSYGIVFGVDGVIAQDVRLGFAVSTSKTNVTSSSSSTKQTADVNTYQLISYGSYALASDLEAHFQADLGYSSIDGKRDMYFTSTTAYSDIDNWNYHLAVGLAKGYRLSDKTTLNLIVNADYTFIDSSSYLETGAGALNLNVSGKHTDELITSLDAHMNHQLSKDLSLKTNLGIGYDWIDDQSKIATSYQGGGASFITEGYHRDPLIGNAGLGVLKTFENGMEVLGQYDLEGREDFISQTGSVKVRWAF